MSSRFAFWFAKKKKNAILWYHLGTNLSNRPVIQLMMLHAVVKMIKLLTLSTVDCSKSWKNATHELHKLQLIFL